MTAGASLWAVREGLARAKKLGADYCIMRRGCWSDKVIAGAVALQLVYRDDQVALNIYKILDQGDNLADTAQPVNRGTDAPATNPLAKPGSANAPLSRANGVEP